ncbi:unnamed protein product [Urochloa humidicola]
MHILSPLLDEKIDEVDGPSLSNATIQEQNVSSSEENQSGGPFPSSEPMAPQHDEYDLERKNRHQPSNPGPLVAWPGDNYNFSGLDEANFAHVEQPPVMGWTVGPQMIILSMMRKVSELAPSAHKPKSNERNLLLEQIRNKTFNLKPMAPAQPTAMRSPARADTRNLKVAAIL